MIQINQLKLNIHHTEADLERKIRKILHLKEDTLLSYQIKKQSIDARKKPDLFFVYTVDVQINAALEKQILRRCNDKNLSAVQRTSWHFPLCKNGKFLQHRPVVIGSGPAGLFCTYFLAQNGYRPILIERGMPVEERLKDVEAFWKTGKLNTESNVQFGEGGAGTFSDGKLNTLVKDSDGRGRKVMEIFAEYGAPKEILYVNKPHIGTDVLINVVRNMRNAILENGGEVLFHTKMTDIHTRNTDGSKQLESLLLTDTLTGEERILPTDITVLALGHSARDTFQMLYERGIDVQAKSFAVGVRVEHPQAMINLSQYGREHPDILSAASYKLTTKLENGRGVYTFCMCPGGYVVNASSEQERLAVNGMSYHARDGRNANSAVIVTVTPEDYGGSHPLAGVAFQRKLEEAAYREGKGSVPVQTFGDYRRNMPSEKLGTVIPQIKGKYRLSNVRNIFPGEIGDSIEQGILAFDRKIPGYAGEDTILSGVESRTSSPLRINRDAQMESPVKGIYPCGEGAGYAGGITSAAMDGIKTAEAIAKKYLPFDKARE
ncbi:FAD-dependent oxidoreductase [Dorea acetigenes]|uniref:FAD-dependent oxidoreductase n=1 Tax=Dorea acetigenes TaxID=2981787 RepID=A0ABT2RJJ0_9FIRM|nr:FAD-dependent oxidoreductase [Dorea acetigenes]MCU6685501.1 FAD-dependent oxidoreductase [Dorea acetigenes]SCI53799.1 Pyridine nucleotide-disulphide oxidoreductase [uncultured Clostridium sp.]